MIKHILAVFLFLSMQLLHAESEADHNELRQLISSIENTINSEQYDDLAQYFSKEMKVTPINQEFLGKHSEIVPWFEKWFGKNGKIEKLEIKLTADAKTKFYSDTIGIVYGHGEEKYILSDTRKFDMLTRWTATVIKEDDGKWRILTLHIGTNFMDNPLLAAAENSIKMFGAIGAIAGLLLGLLLGFLFWKKRK
ncbi:MAG: hypothetical protein U9R26_08350 [Campylobacterota bacterium]|nr:hypothetical protein [Campylobacterota bacterium]